ncbi:GNAT family N-acetyltransferase [Streptomonospora arabica]|uniref:GNAT family N-acetyltransferase n=1 Tax=Streptomonospora arabica TaxID=412417 RepID=A0ABV9SQL4_9ACTN
MFTMRPATAADVPGVAAMLRARCDWMEERGIPSWRGSVDDLAGQAANGAMWVLGDGGGRTVGCTTVLPRAPATDWTPDEVAEPSLYLFTTATDPAYREHRPGTLIALWAVDRAARHGRFWVRRGCYDPALARYYQQQGFTLVRERPREGLRLYLLARRAEHLDLGVLGPARDSAALRDR